MQNIPSKIKEAILLLNEKKKEEIIFKLMKNFPAVYDFVEYNYTDVYDLFIQCQKEVDSLLQVKKSQRPIQVDLLDGINAALKTITAFQRKTNSYRLEIYLSLHILKYMLTKRLSELGTAYSSLDTKLAALVLKVIILVKKYRPEDSWKEYAKEIDKYIEILKEASPHVKAVSKLPNSFFDS